MSITKRDIDTLKSQVVLSDFLNREFNLVGLKKSGKSLKCVCPFHDAKEKNFEINDSKGNWKCWSDDCGSGDIFEALKTGRNMSFFEAVKYVGDQVGYRFDNVSEGQSFSSVRDMSSFSTSLYKHFKHNDFDTFRDAVSHNLNLSPENLNGEMRCDPLKIREWIDLVDSNSSLKQAIVNLGYEDSRYGVLNQDLTLLPMVRLRRYSDNLADHEFMSMIATSNGIGAIEVLGFKVFNSESQYVGCFPKDFDETQAVCVPMLSDRERLLVNNTKLIAFDTLRAYEESIESGMLNSIFMGSTLTYNQMNSLMMIAPQESIVFNCSESFTLNSDNWNHLLLLASRVKNKGIKCELKINGNTFSLHDYCLSHPERVRTTEQLYSFGDLIKGHLKGFEYSRDFLALATSSIMKLRPDLISPIDFVSEYLGGKSLIDKQRHTIKELECSFGSQRDEDVIESLSHFSLPIEALIAYDLEKSVNLAVGGESLTPSSGMI